MKVTVSNYKKFFGWVIVIACGSIVLTMSTPASALPTNQAPEQSDVKPYKGTNADGNNTMTFEVAKADYIKVKKSYLKIYSPTNKIMVSVAGADMCPTNEIHAGVRDQRSPTIDDPSIMNGTTVSTFTLKGYDGGSSDSANGKKRDSSYCSSDSTPFPQAGFPLSFINTDPTTKNLVATSNLRQSTQNGPLYVFTLIATWDADGLCQSRNCGVNAFKVQALPVIDGKGNLGVGGSYLGNSQRVYVAPQGRDEAVKNQDPDLNAADFGMRVGRNNGLETEVNQDKYYTDYDSYFGPSCIAFNGITSTPKKKPASIQIYDDDNFESYPAQARDHAFLVRVEELPQDQNNWGTASGADILSITPSPNTGTTGLLMNSTESYGGVTWRKVAAKGSGSSDSTNPNSNGYLDINFTVQEGYKYRFRIARLDRNNNIQFQLPYSGLWSVEKCPDWELQPHSAVDPAVAYPGDTIEWEHDVENVGGKDSPAGVKYKIEQDIPAPKRTVESGTLDPIAPGDKFKFGKKTYVATVADVGKTICQILTINPYKAQNTPQGNNVDPNLSRISQACAIIKARPPQNVIIEPHVITIGEDAEVGESSDYTTFATIKNYPKFQNDDWPSLGEATKLPAQRQLETVPYSSDNTNLGAPAAVKGSCTHHQGGISTNPCDRWNWTCPNNGYTYNDQANTPTCPDSYRHVCTGAGGYQWTDTNSTGTCTNQFSCNKGAAYKSSNGLPCNYWKCQYGASGVKNSDIFGMPGQPTSWPTSGAAQVFEWGTDPGVSQCQARCSGGGGDIAGQAEGPLFDQGDLHCYERPSFTIKCVSSTRPTNPAIPDVSIDFTVNKDGDACKNLVSNYGSVIGETICMRVTPSVTSPWQPQDPGNVTGQGWGMIVNPKFDEKCKKVIGKPYVRVVGGDAATGRAAALKNNACTLPSSGAQIKAYAKKAASGDAYQGSGASVAAFAYSAIDGFSSGQFAIPILGGTPNALTFAHNGSGNWGSGWGATPYCVGIEKFAAAPEVAGTPAPTGPAYTNIGATLGLNGENRRYIKGNVYISGNITYANSDSGSWVNINAIPLYQLVVEGDIYIASNVTRLDGTYLALPDSTGNRGNVYTCSSGPNANVTQSWGSCKQQLVVNGALIANKVFLSRDCSSLFRSFVPETTVYTGGTDAQNCSPSGTKAAEVFNFLPEQWIRSSAGVPSDKYDSITNMPPIL